MNSERYNPKKNNSKKNLLFEVKEWHDYTKKIPNIVEVYTLPEDIIHGNRAINKQLPKFLRKETFDVDVFTEKPYERAIRMKDKLEQTFGKEAFTLEKGKHEGTYKLKLRYTKQDIADFSKIPKDKMSWVKIKGKRYASLKYVKRHNEETLENPDASFRHEKDRKVLENIKTFENEYKNITKEQFRNSPQLIKQFGKWNNTDGDSKPNWTDCRPFNPLRQDVKNNVLRRTSQKITNGNILRRPISSEQIKQDKQYTELTNKIDSHSKDFENLTSVEDYEQRYNKLPEDIKQYFSSVEEVKKQTQENQQKYLAESKTNYQAEIEKEKKRLEGLKENYYSIKKKDFRDSQSYKDARDYYKDKIKEQEYFYKALENNFQKIKQGYDWRSVYDYAQDYGNYRYDKYKGNKNAKEAEIDKLIKGGLDKISATNYVTNTLKETGKLPSQIPMPSGWTGTVQEYDSKTNKPIEGSIDYVLGGYSTDKSTHEKAIREYSQKYWNDVKSGKEPMPYIDTGYSSVPMYINKELNPEYTRLKEIIESQDLNKTGGLKEDGKSNVVSRILDTRTNNNSIRIGNFSKEKREFYEGVWGISGEYAPKIFNFWSPINIEEIKELYETGKGLTLNNKFLSKRINNLSEIAKKQWNLEKEGIDWIIGRYVKTYKEILLPLAKKQWELEKYLGKKAINYYKGAGKIRLELGKKQWELEKYLGKKAIDYSKILGNKSVDYTKRTGRIGLELGKRQFELQDKIIEGTIKEIGRFSPTISKIAKKQWEIEKKLGKKAINYYKEIGKKGLELEKKQWEIEKKLGRKVIDYSKILGKDSIDYYKGIGKIGLELGKKQWEIEKSFVTGVYNLPKKIQRVLTSPYPERYINLETGNTNYFKDVVKDYIKEQTKEYQEEIKNTKIQVDNLSKEIDEEKQKNVDKSNNWIGTQEDLEKYNRKVEDYEERINLLKGINKNRIYIDDEKEYNQNEWISRLEKEREEQSKQYENLVYKNIGGKKYNLQTLRENSEIIKGLLPSEGGEQVKLAQDFILFDRAFKLAKKGINLATEIYKQTGSKYISPDKIYSKQVLEEGQTFPTSRNVEEILKKFKEAGDEVSHQTKITPKRETTIGGGKKLRPEDEGLYVTPKGEGSPYFLDIKPEGKITKYSFNPFKGLFKSPQDWDIKTKGIEKIPKDILSQAIKIEKEKGAKESFNFINKWLEEQSRTGKAYIPLRSELRHTAETQAIIPKGTNIQQIIKGNILNKIKGYEYYTIYNGRVIPIKKFDVKVGKPNIKNFEKSKDEIKKLREKNIDYYKNYEGIEYKSPYSKILSTTYKPYTKKQKAYAIERYKYENEKYEKSTPTKYDKSYYKEEPYKPDKYERYEPYKGYEPYEGYEPYIKITPYIPTIPKVNKRRGMIPIIRKDKKVTAYRPIILKDDGQEIHGGLYWNRDGAINEGMILTDKLPEEKFTIKKFQANPSEIKKGRQIKLKYKFQQSGNVWTEKKVHRNDRPREKKGKFNWMRYVTTGKVRY